MNTQFLKILSVIALALAFTASSLVAGDDKKKECPCEKDKPKAVVSEEEKKDCKKCCPSEKPKA
ncbi:MAG: hypothetical protein RL105_1358 [Verrucomicrobiota bacterium]